VKEKVLEKGLRYTSEKRKERKEGKATFSFMAKENNYFIPKGEGGKGKKKGEATSGVASEKRAAQKKKKRD